VASAAALVTLLNTTACGSGDGAADPTVADTSVPTTTDASPPSTPSPSTSLPPTTVPLTTVPPPTRPVTTAPTTVVRRPATTAATTPGTTTLLPSTTFGGSCSTTASGQTGCVIPGRPLRRWWRRALLLPATGDEEGRDEARAEYASVASFGELALRLLAVGAPPGLVAACHEAALDEIRHARLCDELTGRPPSAFGAIRGLTGHRLGGWRRSRQAQLRALAVESFLDGWINEGAAAAQLRLRAAQAGQPSDRDRLLSMADDEQRHADLARSIITWCFEEEPAVVGRALAKVAPVPVAA
jgi:hypothetical protein